MITFANHDTHTTEHQSAGSLNWEVEIVANLMQEPDDTAVKNNMTMPISGSRQERALLMR
jgi:hypothetical protein